MNETIKVKQKLNDVDSSDAKIKANEMFRLGMTIFPLPPTNKKPKLYI